MEEKLKIDGILNVTSPFPKEILAGFRKIDGSEINKESYKYVVIFPSKIECKNETKKDEILYCSRTSNRIFCFASFPSLKFMNILMRLYG